MDTAEAGSLGGKARAKKLTKKQRSESAKHAQKSRVYKSKPKKV